MSSQPLWLYLGEVTHNKSANSQQKHSSSCDYRNITHISICSQVLMILLKILNCQVTEHEKTTNERGLHSALSNTNMILQQGQHVLTGHTHKLTRATEMSVLLTMLDRRVFCQELYRRICAFRLVQNTHSEQMAGQLHECLSSVIPTWSLNVKSKWIWFF